MGGAAARVAERTGPASGAEVGVCGEDPHECEAREGGIEAKGGGPFGQECG